MMHHSYNWFHEKVKTVLENKINQTDILFCGHEHDLKTGVFENLNNKIVLIKAGAFDSDDYNTNTFFNVVTYSTEDKEIKVEEYTWNKNDSMFISRENGTFKKCNRKKCNYSLDFSKDLFVDGKTNIGLGLFDYFVFPEMRIDKEDKRIQNYKELKKYIFNNRVISISGKSESGRTTLLKYLYNDIRNEKCTLFINSNNMNNSNIKRIIRSAINDQIAEELNVEKFLQLPKEDKIVFIDDFDKIENSTIREKLLTYLSSIFEHIIITVSSDSVISLKEKFKEFFGRALFQQS